MNYLNIAIKMSAHMQRLICTCPYVADVADELEEMLLQWADEFTKKFPENIQREDKHIQNFVTRKVFDYATKETRFKPWYFSFTYARGLPLENTYIIVYTSSLESAREIFNMRYAIGFDNVAHSSGEYSDEYWKENKIEERYYTEIPANVLWMAAQSNLRSKKTKKVYEKRLASTDLCVILTLVNKLQDNT